MLSLLQSQASARELVAALAPLQVEAADLEVLICEIRFDEQRMKRRPRRQRCS